MTHALLELYANVIASLALTPHCPPTIKILWPAHLFLNVCAPKFKQDDYLGRVAYGDIISLVTHTTGNCRRFSWWYASQNTVFGIKCKKCTASQLLPFSPEHMCSEEMTFYNQPLQNMDLKRQLRSRRPDIPDPVSTYIQFNNFPHYQQKTIRRNLVTPWLRNIWPDVRQQQKSSATLIRVMEKLWFNATSAISQTYRGETLLREEKVRH